MKFSHLLEDREAREVLFLPSRSREIAHAPLELALIFVWMGNQKNRRATYSKHNRHAYRKKKLPWGKKKLKSQTVNNPILDKEKIGSLEGSRIINLDQLQLYTENISKHAVVLNGESRDGLASILSAKCTTCSHVIAFPTSTKVKGTRGYKRWQCNLAAVWGQMVTGGGHSNLEESMSIVGVPVMTNASFVQTERAIGEAWKQELLESMAEAGREEKRLAEQRNEYHEGVPAITGIVDGGWSKQSHKHSYNANSGVGIIVGAATKNILFIGVRNKYCSACARNIPTDKHKCYRNWNRSSSEMETDIILDGFMEAERVHGVRYMKFIGDGDSSVYTTLLQSVPGWGHAIKKLECANHACKCYRGALERLVQDNPSYKGTGGLTNNQRRRLVAAARSAIRMRSKEKDQGKALSLLQRDLRNGPLHCFGFHRNCSTDFCTTAQKNTSMTSSSVPPLPSELSNSELSMSKSLGSPAATTSLSLQSSSASSTSMAMRSTSSTPESSSSAAADPGSSQTWSTGSSVVNF